VYKKLQIFVGCDAVAGQCHTDTVVTVRILVIADLDVVARVAWAAQV
jgi:hypothetical protein